MSQAPYKGLKQRIKVDKLDYFKNAAQKQVSVVMWLSSTSAFRQGVLGSNSIAARKSCEVYLGLGILQPQWNPYPTLTPPSC